MTEETKICPYCDGIVLNTAKKCKHCGEWLPTDSSQTNQEKENYTCKFCKYNLPLGATKCPYCGEWQDDKIANTFGIHTKDNDINCNIAKGCNKFCEILYSVVCIIVVLAAIPTIGISLIWGIVVAIGIWIAQIAIITPVAIAELKGQKTVAIIILILNILLGYTLISVIISWVWAYNLDGHVTFGEAWDKISEDNKSKKRKKN